MLCCEGIKETEEVPESVSWREVSPSRSFLSVNDSCALIANTIQSQVVEEAFYTLAITITKIVSVSWRNPGGVKPDRSSDQKRGLMSECSLALWLTSTTSRIGREGAMIILAIRSF